LLGEISDPHGRFRDVNACGAEGDAFAITNRWLISVGHPITEVAGVDSERLGTFAGR
jgi:hypothetical protein